MPDILLDAVAIRQYLHELAQELAPDGAAYTLVVVGGSLLALHGLRDSTADVDTIAPLNDELRDAIATVATRHDLALN